MLGVVVGVLQYKVSRQQATAPVGPATGQYRWSAGPTSAAIPHEPPGAVRAVAVWAVLDALVGASKVPAAIRRGARLRSVVDPGRGAVAVAAPGH